MKTERVCLARCLILVGTCLGLVVLSSGVLGQNSEEATLAEDFIAGRFSQARDDLSTIGPDDSSPNYALFNLLLTTDPGQASALLKTLDTSGSHPRRWQLRWALEAADLAFARENFGEVLQDLEPLLAGDQGLLPGRVFLLAGLASRGLGMVQKAREMFASVKPQDSTFAFARDCLGDIALEQDDPVLALRYFESAAAPGRANSAVAGGGVCRALRAMGRDAEADSILLRHSGGGSLQHPGGLSWLALTGLSPQPALPDSTPATSASARQAKFCLQLGAFRDRGLALDLLRKHAGNIPDLRIEPTTGAKGETLYRVRCGAFNNPEAARAMARDLQDRYGLDVIVKGTD